MKSFKEYRKEAEELLKELTLEEKASLATGSDDWHMAGIERLGLEPVYMTDGPHGVRVMPQEGMSEDDTKSTCFTALSAAACSFDTELMEEAGCAIAEECLEYDVHMILGPGVNIKRSPLCGRNFEYMSEDPVLAGKMSAGLIRGIQSQGIPATLKHFACNNQEKYRMITDAVVDERALREIYFKPYEIAIKEAGAANVMCSYNKINGEHASDNHWLLTEVLRDEIGFEGLVVSDWGAMDDWVRSAHAGLDVTMPGGGLEERKSVLLEAVKEGSLAEEDLDRIAVRVLTVLLNSRDLPHIEYDRAKHDAVVRKVAANSMVLLENDGALPLKAETSLVVLGSFAKEPRFQGAGSSQTKPNKLTSVLDELTNRGIDYTYSEAVGLEEEEPDDSKISAAIAMAKKSGIALVCAGLPASYESESGDRATIELPKAYIELINRLTREGIKTIVVLMGGSAMALPFRKDVNAMVLAGLTGQANGQAICDVLYGDVNPGGRLSETYPLLEELQEISDFGQRDVKYKESIYVGYRYYDKAKRNVAYPFGYGKSYTEFEYTNMRVSDDVLTSSDSLTVYVDVTNVGPVAGSEVVQLYVEAPETKLYKPVRELKGFTKLYLAPGVTKTAEITVNAEDLSYYNAVEGCWHLEAGQYAFEICKDSRNVICKASVHVTGDSSIEVPDYRLTAPDYYRLKEVTAISEDSFKAIYGREYPPEYQSRPFHTDSTLGDVLKVGIIGKIYHLIEPKLIESLVDMGGLSEEEKKSMDMGVAKVLIDNVLEGLPLRNLVNLTQGKLKRDGVGKLIRILNFFHPVRK